MLKGIIFDMDGVISDTQTLHASIESAILSHHGIAMTPEAITKKYAGVKDEIMFQELFSRFGVAYEVARAVNEKWQRMREMSQNGIVSIPGAVELIESLERKGFLLAVASSSPLAFIKHVLESLQIKKRFRVIASAEEVVQGKPAPDIFWLAARRLGLVPEECVVIEDGVNGMIGAEKAGMKCIAFAAERTHSEYPADWIVSSLGEITSEKIQML